MQNGRLDVIVHGADSETLHGRPMTLQFYSEDIPENIIYFVDESTATDAFLQWLNGLPRKVLHVVYVHNLPFDMPEFFWSVKNELISQGSDFQFAIGDWNFSGVYGAPSFVRISGPSKTQVLIVDSHLWYQGSLAKAAELFCPDLPKLARPTGLGKLQFKKSDTLFCEYAMRDAEIDYHIGKSVQRIVSEFDIRQPVSLADMASKIFKHRFLSYTIPQPKHAVILGAMRSYHGGKNNLVPGAAPAWHSNISAFDISSAYPYAMSQLPAFSDQRLYRKLAKQNGTRLSSVPELGVYQVSGVAAPCDWPSLFDHSFDALEGKFERVWIQGYELNEALRTGEVRISSIRGTYYEAEKDNQAPALRGFVDHFYRLKEIERDAVLRHMYKTILNSLYGKFIQTRKKSDVLFTDMDTLETVESHEVVAGGMFHPFIASCITAHTRAFIHQLEHEHRAIHTATDGILTNAKRVRHVPMAAKKGLGSIKIEGQNETVMLVRNKCYVRYGKEGKQESQVFKGKRIVKYALHGFQGTVTDLERLIASGERRYTVARPNRLRESLKRGLDVNDFVTRPYILKVGDLKVIE